MNLRKMEMRMWTGFMQLRDGPVTGSCGHGNEPLSSVKCWEFADLLGNCKILNVCITESVNMCMSF
jgi:hypothetical protein